MVKYTKIENPHSIFECCDFPKPPYDPGTGDCCYDYWTSDLFDVNNELRCATAVASHKQREYGYVTDWYNALKGWCTDWEQADVKADTLCRSLELFIKHLGRICKITKKTARAIDILFCMIEDLYVRVDYLKDRFDQLTKCISCLKNPSLSSGGIITCLANYSSSLDAVIATRDVLIGKVIVAIEYAYGLHDNICDDYGLKSILVYWTNVLNCHGNATPEPEERNEGGDHCELKPHITFSIDKAEYFNELKTLREEVKKRMHHLKEESDKANEKMSALQACQAGLNKAITASGLPAKCGA